MAKATATKIKEDPVYEYALSFNGTTLSIEADSYRSFGANDELLDFFLKDESVASFKNWDYVIRCNKITSSSGS